MPDSVTSPTYSIDESRKDEKEESYDDFTSEEDISEEEKTKLVTKLDDMFTYALDHPNWTTGRKNMIKCFKYREGEQWTERELQELEERSQPDTTNNQIAVVVNKLVGDLINQRFRTGYRGRNAAQDEKAAELLTDIFLYVRQSNELEFEERDMADDGFTCGMGVLRVNVEFDDMFLPEIKVKHEDALIIFPDPDSRRYDWNEDALFVASAKWVPLEHAVEMFPQAKLRLDGLFSQGDAFGDSSSGAQLADVDKFKGEIYIDQKQHRIRIIEVEYKKTTREQIMIHSDGTVHQIEDKKQAREMARQFKEQGLEYRFVDRLSHQICCGKYAAGVLLEHKVTPDKVFSLVPYWAYRRKTGEPFSLVTLALSMQDAVNKRESKAIHLINTNQTTYEKSSLDDPVKFAQEKARPDGMKEVRDGALANQRIVEQQNLELAVSQYNMHKGAIEDLYRILGIDPRMGQTTGEIRSGTGLQRKYAEAYKPIATLFDNVRRTNKILARVVLDRIQNYYTPEKIALITDKPEQWPLDITKPLLERIKTALYDVVQTEFEDDPTTQDEQYRIFAETLPNILPFGPFYSKLLLQMSRVRDKDKVIQMLDAQSGPPPIEPKMSVQVNLDALTPIERAAIWERAGVPDVAEAVRQLQPETTTEQKGRVELQKTAAKTQGDMVKAQGEQVKMQLDIAGKEMDLRKKQMDIQHTALKASMPEKKKE